MYIHPGPWLSNWLFLACLHVSQWPGMCFQDWLCTWWYLYLVIFLNKSMSYRLVTSSSSSPRSNSQRVNWGHVSEPRMHPHGEQNHLCRYVLMIANMDLNLKLISIRKAKAQEEKVINTHTGSKIGSPWFSKGETIETNWSRNGLRLTSDNLRRGCRLQDGGAVQGRSESRSRVIVHRRGGREARLSWGGFENMMRSWVMKWGTQQGLGVVAFHGWGAGRSRRKEGEWGEGPSFAISVMFCSEFAHVFRLSVSMRKVAGEHQFCVIKYINSYIFHIHFMYLLYCHIQYLILYAWRYHWPTHMELLNTHAHTYTDTHTHAHTKTKKHTKKETKTKKEDVKTISKPQSLTSVRIKDCTLRVPNKTTTLFLYE